MPHSLEQCIKVYGVHFEINKDPKTRIILELDDLTQVAEQTAEQKGFYELRNKVIARPAKPKMKLGSQNKPDLFYRNRCPVKGCKPIHAPYRYFSAKGLMMHLKQIHPGYVYPDVNPINVRIEAYDYHQI